MAKAKKRSGSYRVLAYSHTDADGKRHYESFTAPTKAEAEMMAAEFSASKKRRARHDLTVGEAIDGYIRAKEGVLSPSTIRGYRQLSRSSYDSIKRKKIRSLTTEDMQLFISEISSGRSPKTVANIYGLLVPAIAMYAPDVSFKVTLPPKDKKRPVSPSDDAVRLLYEKACDKMKVCISFAMCGLRRSEMCGLRYEDIKDGTAYVHADMVKNSDSEWVYKNRPKTADGNRHVQLPSTLISLIGDGEGYIIKWTPDSITKRFIELRRSLGLDIRFHDLRHYFASTAAVLGVPDIYTADMGGWTRSSKVMKAVYQNNIASMSDYYANKLTGHIESIMQPDMQPRKQKSH